MYKGLYKTPNKALSCLVNKEASIESRNLSQY